MSWMLRALAALWPRAALLAVAVAMVAGALTLFRAEALPPTIDLDSTSADLTVYGDDAGDASGIAVAAGDINGDTTDDLIIGAYGADPAGGAAAGETYVIYGGDSLPATIDLNSASADLTVYGDDAYDNSGSAVAAGDMDGDTTDDLIIGAHYADPAGGASAGETYVIYGGSSLPTTIDLNTTSAGLTVYGDDAGDYSGWSVGAGDIDGDTTDDLMIGADQADGSGTGTSCGTGQVGDRCWAGESYVIYGGAQDPTPAPSSTPTITPTPTVTPTPCPPEVCTPTPTPTLTSTPTSTPVPPNAMAIDADPSTQPVDAAFAGIVGQEFDVSTNITEAAEAYAGYVMYIEFDDSVLGFVPVEPANIVYTGLGGMTLEAWAVEGDGDGDTIPDVWGGAARSSGTTNATGQANLVRFQCIGVGATTLHLITQAEQPPPAFPSTTIGSGGLIIPTALTDASVTCAPCMDRVGDTSCEDEVNDPDDDGCTTSEEVALGSAFDAFAWYDFYDVPVPAKPDSGPGSGANGTRDRAVAMDDVLAVLFYVGTYDGDAGDVPNPNGVRYDTIKGVDLDGDTTNDIPPPLHQIKEGVKYDRSAGPEPNPPWEVGPPDGAVSMDDVLANLAQVGLQCTG